MLKILKKIIDFFLDLLVSEAWQSRLGMHIVNRIRGDDNYDPETNGEYWALRTIKKQIKDSHPVIFDVGSHVGEWSKQAASDLPPGAAVYSFEPARSTFAELKKIIAAEGLAGLIYPFNTALSDQDGSGTFYVDSVLAGTNSLYQQRYHEPWRDVTRPKTIETVQVMRGDTFCRQHGIGHIHFLKIDAEAHDIEVLRGFKDMLSNKNIDYIQFEYCHSWINAGHFLREAIELLHEQKYRVGKYRGNRVVFLDRYEVSYEKFEFANFFAARPELERFWHS